MTELLAAVTSWQTYLGVILLFGFLPGFVLRLVLLLYPRKDERRAELLGELYAMSRLQRPVWVAEQIETALWEGPPARVRAWRRQRLVKAALRADAEAKSELLRRQAEQAPRYVDKDLRAYVTDAEYREDGPGAVAQANADASLLERPEVAPEAMRKPPERPPRSVPWREEMARRRRPLPRR